MFGQTYHDYDYTSFMLPIAIDAFATMKHVNVVHIHGDTIKDIIDVMRMSSKQHQIFDNAAKELFGTVISMRNGTNFYGKLLFKQPIDFSKWIIAFNHDHPDGGSLSIRKQWASKRIAEFKSLGVWSCSDFTLKYKDNGGIDIDPVLSIIPQIYSGTKTFSDLAPYFHSFNRKYDDWFDSWIIGEFENKFTKNA